MTAQQLALVPSLAEVAVETVYYATDMCNIKIGRSRSPRRRGGELKVEMLMTFAGGQLDERRHHRMWKRYRIGSSEWFRAEPELLLWLNMHVEAGTRSAAVLRHLTFMVMSRGSEAA
jgi:hypothetical protein